MKKNFFNQVKTNMPASKTIRQNHYGTFKTDLFLMTLLVMDYALYYIFYTCQM